MLNQVSLIDLSRPQRPLPSPRSLARANGEDRRLCRADELSPKRQASAKITSCSLVICLAVPINRGINSLSTSRQALHRPNPLSWINVAIIVWPDSLTAASSTRTGIGKVAVHGST